MKLNIANPATGCQKLIEVDDEKKLQAFYDKRIAQEVEGDKIGMEFEGYIMKIMGGQDKQGFPMKQGVLTPNRVRLLLHKNVPGNRGYLMKKGERKRRSVRGCIVSHETSVLNLAIVKKGKEEIPGLTDKTIPRRLGPKRANNIRKLFNLTKEDDVRQYVIRREVTTKSGKTTTKAPKIQRLITPLTLQRRRRRKALKKRAVLKSKAEAASYEKLIAQRNREARESRRASASKRKSVSKKE